MNPKLTAAALGCPKPTGNSCYCRRTCPAHVAIVKLALELAGKPYDAERGPMDAHNLAGWVQNVAIDLEAGCTRRPSRESVREGARLAGYGVDSRGRVLCGFNGDYDPAEIVLRAIC